MYRMWPWSSSGCLRRQQGNRATWIVTAFQTWMDSIILSICFDTFWSPILCIPPAQIKFCRCTGRVEKRQPAARLVNGVLQAVLGGPVLNVMALPFPLRLLRRFDATNEWGLESKFCRSEEIHRLGPQGIAGGCLAVWGHRRCRFFADSHLWLGALCCLPRPCWQSQEATPTWRLFGSNSSDSAHLGAFSFLHISSYFIVCLDFVAPFAHTVTIWFNLSSLQPEDSSCASFWPTKPPFFLCSHGEHWRTSLLWSRIFRVFLFLSYNRDFVETMNQHYQSTNYNQIWRDLCKKDPVPPYCCEEMFIAGTKVSVEDSSDIGWLWKAFKGFQDIWESL